MKPTLQITDDNSAGKVADRRFPITDFQYNSIGVETYNAHCANSLGNSFRTSREYFANEAARDFVTEAVVFSALMLTVAAPLLSGVSAIFNLLRASVGI